MKNLVSPFILIPLILTLSCAFSIGEGDDDDASIPEKGKDADEDGFASAVGNDCNDEDPSVYPGAEEIPYDGVDQDCDGSDLTDVDGDGFDFTEIGGQDCNDEDPEINPEALDHTDGKDNDCDGETDIIFVPDAFDTLQEGIIMAWEGDTIGARGGTYYETVRFYGKAVTLLGVDGPENTVIDSSGSGSSTVLFDDGEGPDTLISGFYITGGTGEACPFTMESTCGGGIYIFDSSPQVQGNIIEGNEAYMGGGVFISYYGAPHIIQNVITGNYSSYQGGGICLYGYAEGNIYNNLILNNYSTNYGGGIALYYYSGGTVVNNTIYDNYASNSTGGGGIYTYYSDLELVNNIIYYHTRGYGIYKGDSYYTTSVIYNDVYSNSSANYGGYLSDQTGANGNVSVDPSFVSISHDDDWKNDDYHLSSWSSLLDAGSPDIEDPDGSRSDIGAYGGPYGDW